MKLLFGRKMMIAYIVILCLTFIAGTVSVGFTAYYTEKYNIAVKEIEEKNKKNSGLTDTENIVLELITNALSKETGTDLSSKTTLTDEAKGYRQNKSDAIIATIVLYVFSLLSVAGIITCVQYDKYLKSEKYKAKLKRMKRYENSYNTGM